MSDGRLPPADTPEQYRAVRGRASVLRAAVAALAREQGWSSDEPEPFEEGSLPVFGVGRDLAVKLFPRYDAVGHRVERAALLALDGRLPIATPRLVEEGERDGWTWMAMRRIAGWPLSQVWDSIPRDEQLDLGARLGETLAVLHALPTQDVEVLRPSWPAFVAHQREHVEADQRRLGLEDPWAATLAPFVDSTGLRLDAAPTFLHTEVMADHVLAAQVGARWRLTGLVDFEPAMIGAAEYEFASVGLFVTQGDGPLLGRILDGYGLPAGERTPELQRRYLAYALLHRYAHVAAWFRRLGAPAEGTTWDDLARTWWALA